MRKVSRKSVKPKMSPEDESELHDRHDASYERQMQAESTILKEVVSGLYAGIAQSAMDKLKSKDFGKKKDEPTEPTAARGDIADKDLTPEQRKRRRRGEQDAQDAMDRGETEVQIDAETGDAIIGGQKPSLFQDMFPAFTKEFGGPSTPASSTPASTAPGAVAGETKDIADTSPPMPNAQDSSEDTRDDISPSKKESVFYVASVLREDDEDYSDDEISRDKDPDAAGGPYSEDDIKVTQDPRDAAPGMDPVADPPTLQAKQVTTGMAYKAPAAVGTMQTMLPGGEHDAIQKQYPDLIEGLCGGSSDMKGGFLTDPKDKKKAMAAMALMSSLDKKLKEDKKTRLKKILNTKNPPAMPGAEGY